MNTEILEQIAALLAVCLVFLFINIKAASRWLGVYSIVGALTFLLADLRERLTAAKEREGRGHRPGPGLPTRIRGAVVSTDDKYVPKVGDTVEVLLRGKVTKAWPESFVMADENLIDQNHAHVVSVEKVADPLPTTPGSVIVMSDCNVPAFRVLGGDGKWWAAWGGAIKLDPQEHAHLLLAYRTFSDAGKAQS